MKALNIKPMESKIIEANSKLKYHREQSKLRISKNTFKFRNFEKNKNLKIGNMEDLTWNGNF